MNGLDIFAGSGIGSLAMKQIIPNYRTIGYVEFEKYPYQIIEARIKDGILDDAPIWQIDIREFNRRIAPIYKGMVDIIYGGFPCQPFSVAGKNKGADDERNMWPATLECLSIIRPRFAFLENVPNILTHEYIRRIFGDLAEIGYDCEWDIVSAAFVGAPHIRRRTWILAYDMRKQAIRDNEGRLLNQPARSGEEVDNTISLRQPQSKGSVKNIGGRPGDAGWWSVEPNVGRTFNGMANGLVCIGIDRFRGVIGGLAR